MKVEPEVLHTDDYSKFERGPIRHRTLPDSLVERIKVVKEVLAEVDHTSAEKTLESFKRERDPEPELLIWELIAASYERYVSQEQIEDLDTREEVFRVLLGLSMGAPEESFRRLKHLNREQVRDLARVYGGYEALN